MHLIKCNKIQIKNKIHNKYHPHMFRYGSAETRRFAEDGTLVPEHVGV